MRCFVIPHAQASRCFLQSLSENDATARSLLSMSSEVLMLNRSAIRRHTGEAIFKIKEILFPALPDFLRSSGSRTGSTHAPEDN
jgi:hypothetical protein